MAEAVDLDDLLNWANEVDEEKKVVKEDDAEKLKESAWYENKHREAPEVVKGAKGKNLHADLWDTAVEKLDLSSLVWSKCCFFKGGSNYLPAIVRDPSLGVGITGLPWPFPDDHVLIEYICGTKENPSIPRLGLQKK